MIYDYDLGNELMKYDYDYNYKNNHVIIAVKLTV